MRNVTWDDVVELVNRSAGLTNRQITEALDANHQDVTHLSRIAAKAGEISFTTAPGVGGVMTKTYLPADKEATK